MLISRKWLEQFVQLPEKLTNQQLAEALTMSTVEVEGVTVQAEAFQNMLVGRVHRIEAHPDASKLRLAAVDLGSEKIRLVCGASNLYEGMLVAVALPGAKVRWHGEGDWVTLETAKIRGVESAGMICAAAEIGLAAAFAESDGVIDLTSLEAAPGTPLAEALGKDDVLLEVDNKSLANRPDLWGHYGIARDLAAVLKLPLQPLSLAPVPEGKEVPLSVGIKAKDLCRRYVGAVLANVQVRPSPAWLRIRLEAVGVRSISNVVDVTNFVMLELGQPLHAFDLAKLPGPKLVVRRASANERLTTLDGIERVLDAETLVIADAKQPVAIAGVMGGEATGVGEGTTTILLESANFDPVSVRRTAQRLGLRSEASARFEKSLDPHLAETAMLRALTLFRELLPQATLASGIVDEGKWQWKIPAIPLKLDFLSARLGVNLPKEEVQGILQRLEFNVKEKGKGELLVTPPSFRATKDISIPEDLVEEVARVYGFDKLPVALPTVQVNAAPDDWGQQRLAQARQVLAYGCGASETLSYSFADPQFAEALGWPLPQHWQVQQPLSEQQQYLRLSLLPNLLKQLRDNWRFRQDLALFEIGRVFSPERSGEVISPDAELRLPRQDELLAIAYSQTGEEQPLLAVRGMVEALGQELGLPFTFEIPGRIEPMWPHPNRALRVSLNRQPVGWLGELHPKIARDLDLPERVALLELNVTQAFSQPGAAKTFQPWSPFPVVTRDLALNLPKDARYGDLASAIQGVDSRITRVGLFDQVALPQFGGDRKGYGLRLTFRRDDRTWTSEEVDELMGRVTKLVEGKFGAKVR